MKREMLKNTIRWVIAGLLCILLFSGMNASAETIASGECAEGNITWTLDDTGLLTISGTGDMDNYTASNENRAPWYTWKDQIITVTISDGITSIGDAAFYYSSNLTSITIPNGVESIGDYAIYLCSRLTEVIIPDTVRSIGSNAFYSSNNIASINIPDGLVSVGNNAFSGYTTCYADPRYSGARTISKAGYYFREQGANYSLKYLFKSSGEENGLEINKVDQTAETLVIPDEVTYIGQKAFYNCGSLTSVTIPAGVTGIGNEAFSYCSRLRSIAVPDGLTSLGYNTFSSCNATIYANLTSNAAHVLSFYGVSFRTPGANYSLRYVYGEVGGVYGENGLEVSSVDKDVVSVTVPENVTRIGMSAFESCSDLTTVSLPSTLTAIDYYAFRYCYKLSVINIPEGVTSIGGGSFSYCEMLDNVTLPSTLASIGDYAFGGCSQLTGITIPSLITNIENNTFYYCTALTSVTFSGNVQSIGNNAFYNCSALTDITLPTSVTSIGAYAFSGCVKITSLTIPDGVTHIGQYAFSGCNSLVCNANLDTDGAKALGKSGYRFRIPGANFILKYLYDDEEITGLEISDVEKSVTTFQIPEGVTSIADYAFDNCSNLSSVFFQDTIISIGTAAFRFCSSLTDITLPDALTVIGSHAFYACGSLTDFIIPDSVKTIGSYAFYDCCSLTSISIPSGVTCIDDSTFGNNYNSTSHLVSVDIPNTVTSIGRDAFIYCDSLSSITIPDSVTSIGVQAFSGCTSLTGLIIPDTVTSIGMNAFCSCHKLTSMTIPGSVTTIPQYLFQNCSGLSSVVLQEGITNIEDNCFTGCSSLTSVIIPDSVTSISSYVLNTYNGSRIRYYAGYNSYASRYICKAGLKFWIKALECQLTYEFGDNDEITGTELVSIDPCITSLAIPDYVTAISSYAFSGCSNLVNVSIPMGITSIPAGAFYQCSSLTGVTIPNSIVSVGDSAFSGCSSLEGITLPGSITDMGFYTFTDCTGLESIVIPESVTQIGYGVFDGCSSLRSATIPTAVTAINDVAFRNCSSLTGLTVPTALTIIGNDVFDGCPAFRYAAIDSNAAKVLGQGGYSFTDPDHDGVDLIYIDNLLYIDSVWTGCDDLDLRFADLSNIPGYDFLNGQTPAKIRLPDGWSSVPATLVGLKSTSTFITTHNSSLYGYLVQNQYDYLLNPLDLESVSCRDITLNFGKRETLPLQTTPYVSDWLKCESAQFRFTSSDSSIVSVNDKGEMRGLATGSATIWVQDVYDPFVNATVTVNVSSSNIEGGLYAFANLTKGSSSISASFGAQGGTQPYSIICEVYKNGSKIDTKSYSDVYVDGNRATKTINQAINGNVYTYTFKVTVVDAEGLSDTATAYCSREYTVVERVGVGTPTVAMVRDEYGNMGYQYVYPSYQDVYGYVNHLVNDDPTRNLISNITLTDTSLVVGNSKRIAYSTSPYTVIPSELVWQSSNPAIVDIDEEGMLISHDIGKVTITAYTTDGSALHTSCTVVSASTLVESIDLTTGDLDETTQTQQITAVVNPAEATFPELAWSSSNNQIASVDENGLVTWHDAGNVTITATATDKSGVYATQALTWDGILIRELILQRDPNDENHIIWQVVPENATNPNVSFASDNPQVLAIDNAGYMTFLKNGTAHIQATARDKGKVKAQIEINVHITHTEVPYEDKAPTCEEPGHTGGTVCSECGIEIQPATVIPALGHNWNDPTYVWNVDRSEVTATRVCGHDTGATHQETEKGVITSSVSKQATCEAAGETTYVATFTNSAFATQTETVADIPALGHDWSNPIYDWSTDNSKVTATRICKNDASHSETETVNTVESKRTEPTCEQNGSADYTAAFTNAAFTEQKKEHVSISALGHDWNETIYVWNENHSEITATRTCKNADHPESENGQITSAITKQPTCEEKGETTYTATFTNIAFAEQHETVGNIPATGHSWNDPAYEWSTDHRQVTATRVCRHDASHIETETAQTAETIHIAPTCTETGVSSFVAAFENNAFTEQKKENEIVDALGHDRVEEAAVPATCEGTGLTAGAHCGRCNEVLQEQETIPALGHDPVEDAAAEPTCEASGLTAGSHCSRCSTVFAAQQIVPALGHDWDGVKYEWSADHSACTASRTCKRNAAHKQSENGTVTVQTTPATTEAAGKKVYTAAFTMDCFETQTYEEAIPKLDPPPQPQPQPQPEPQPQPQEPPKPQAGPFEDETGKYDIGADGNATFTGPVGSASTVTIPDTVNVNGISAPVTKIADNAFKKSKKLKKINIGNNIREIGDNAFADCKKLKTVNMGSNVERIGNSAFKGCIVLTKITIGEKVNSIGKKAFYGCSKLKTITIKSLLLTKENIGSSAFKKINGKATFKCPKEKKKEYKAILKKKGAPKGAKYK